LLIQSEPFIPRECFKLQYLDRHFDISDFCGAGASPRLCDPPFSEKQAGIGPISQKPELVTMRFMSDQAMISSSLAKEHRKMARGIQFQIASPCGSQNRPTHSKCRPETVTRRW
jgi:hypothetical protein